MAVTLSPTREQRAILERLDLPADVAAALRPTSFALEAQDAETVRGALTEELARSGFDAEYVPTAEGRLIEDLIDTLLSADVRFPPIAAMPQFWDGAAMRKDVQATVLEKVRELTAFPDRLTGEATEIYYDARISGDDLWDLITSLKSEFNTDFSAMNLREYAPSEGAQLLGPLLKFLGRRPYRSLTVASLAEAVEQGAWRTRA